MYMTSGSNSCAIVELGGIQMDSSFVFSCCLYTNIVHD